MIRYLSVALLVAGLGLASGCGKSSKQSELKGSAGGNVQSTVPLPPPPGKK